jgi:hypothetical protein
VENLREAIQIAHNLGAIVMISHITWTQWQPACTDTDHKHPTREELVACGVDGFEINNEVRWYDPESVYFVEAHNNQHPNKPIFLATATDIHNPFEHWVSGWTQLFLKSEDQKFPSIEIIKHALLEARTKIWVSHDYDIPIERQATPNQPKANRFDALFYPFYTIVRGLKASPPGTKKIFMIVIWALLTYLPIRMLFGLIL